VTRRRGRRRRKLLDDVKKMRGYSRLKEEALDRTMWRNRYGGGFEPVVRQNTEWINKRSSYIWYHHYCVAIVKCRAQVCYQLGQRQVLWDQLVTQVIQTRARLEILR